MARKVTILDDLTNEEGAQTVTFTVAGRIYELDLTEANQAKLLKAVERFIKVARDVTPIPRNGSDPYAGIDQTTIRAWALDKGLDVPERGRVPMWAVEAWRKAQEEAPAVEPEEPAQETT